MKAKDVDPATVQLRVGGSCSPGQAIRAVAQGGTVTCEAGQTAAAPLTVTGTTIGLNPCGNGLILKFTGGSWGCAADANTTYSATAGEGLNVTGTNIGISLCGANQILKMTAGGTSWACAADG